MEESQTIGLSPSSRAVFLAALSFLAILGNGCCSSRTFNVQFLPKGPVGEYAIPLSILFAPRDTKMAENYKKTEMEQLLRELDNPEMREIVFLTVARSGPPESHECGPFAGAIEKILIWAALPEGKKSTPLLEINPESLECSGFWPIWPFCSLKGSRKRQLRIDVWRNKIELSKGKEDA